MTALWSSTRTARSPQCRNPAMAVANASLGSFFDALVEPSSRTLAAKVGATSTTCSPGTEELLRQQLAQPPADSTAQVRSAPSGSAPANSRWVRHRPATSRSRASGRSSPSIATAVWVALCGSTPIITVIEVLPVNACERHDGHS
jgi:hypothetical protein